MLVVVTVQLWQSFNVHDWAHLGCTPCFAYNPPRLTLMNITKYLACICQSAAAVSIGLLYHF